MRRRLCVLCLLVLEPCLHAFGLPHPEGLTNLVMTHIASTPEEG